MLTIELVPQTSWFDNVRSQVSKEKWDKIRFTSYRLAAQRCQVCGEKGRELGFDHDVECHEVWDYNEDTGVQKLTGLVSLCPLCHKCKHIGLAEVNGELGLVYKHLMKINSMTGPEVERYVQEEKKIWKRRNKLAWYPDISYIDEYLKDNNTFEAFMSKY